mgnify:CR=1 FL=1
MSVNYQNVMRAIWIFISGITPPLKTYKHFFWRPVDANCWCMYIIYTCTLQLEHNSENIKHARKIESLIYIHHFQVTWWPFNWALRQKSNQLQFQYLWWNSADFHVSTNKWPFWRVRTVINHLSVSGNTTLQPCTNMDLLQSWILKMQR